MRTKYTINYLIDYVYDSSNTNNNTNNNNSNPSYSRSIIKQGIESIWDKFTLDDPREVI